MKLNWLQDIDTDEISYVDRPAIDKRFIAIKRMEDESPKDSAKTNKSFLERVKDSFTSQKTGRVLNKSNEDRLSNVAEMLKNASETIVAVLSTVNKSNKEDSDMEKEELKAMIGEVLTEKFDSLKTELEAKFVVKEADKKDAEDEDKDEDVEDEDEEKKDKKEDAKPEKKENKNEMETLTKKLEEIVSEIKTIKKEIHDKPESDKKDINNSEKKEVKSEDDFTGVFQMGGMF